MTDGEWAEGLNTYRKGQCESIGGDGWFAAKVHIPFVKPRSYPQPVTVTWGDDGFFACGKGRLDDMEAGQFHRLKVLPRIEPIEVSPGSLIVSWELVLRRPFKVWRVTRWEDGEKVKSRLQFKKPSMTW